MCSKSYFGVVGVAPDGVVVEILRFTPLGIELNLVEFS